MTRRDRAAMRFAYELLLRNGARGGLVHASRPLSWVYRFERIAWEIAPERCPTQPEKWRLLRARLALLLRAMLREDGGMREALLSGYTTPYRRADQDTRVIPSRWSREPMRFRALWETAPPHRPTGAP